MNKSRFKLHVLNAFTGKDNETIDIGRILWALGVLVFFGMSVYSAYKGQAFDAVAWGTGFSAVLVAGGAALGFKSKTEPDGTQKEDDKK